MNAIIQKLLPLVLPLIKKKRSWAALIAVAGISFIATGQIPLEIDRLWKEPRELLVDRVSAARDSQQEAAEEFRDALTQFKAVTGFSGGDLERQYNKLNKAYKDSKDAAGDITRRVDRVVAASNRLLTEWRAELGDYNDPQLKRLAEQQFDETRQRAELLIASMRKTEQTMQPVLQSFQDQVLYLKHNLNLSAIASLDEEATMIQSNVDMLIAEMETSIAEADEFIRIILARG
ncbi:MAG: DUF2959 domain-containing protein [Gammaproteobacteria bacterium]|nr:DUF2959 domain-containing protein [Gammaproteobacteria bacterium]